MVWFSQDKQPFNFKIFEEKRKYLVELITKIEKDRKRNGEFNSNPQLSKKRADLLINRHKIDRACWGVKDEDNYNKSLEKNKTILKFSELCMSDPFHPKKGLPLAIKQAKIWNFYEPIYQDHTSTKTRFLPTRTLCR
jgi:hypothetical protein